jgi:hypothetical protein
MAPAIARLDMDRDIINSMLALTLLRKVAALIRAPDVRKGTAIKFQ